MCLLDQASMPRALSRHPSPPNLQPLPRGSPLLHPSASQGAESVSCQGGVGTSLCHPPGGSTCPCRHCRLSWPQYMSPSRQSGTLASQLFLHVPKPCMEPLLWASTPLPLCHLLFPEKAWSEHDLGSHRVLTHHFLPYILNLENWLEGVGRRKGLEAVRRLARGTFQPGAHTLRTCISSFFPLITLNSQNSCLIRATV